MTSNYKIIDIEKDVAENYPLDFDPIPITECDIEYKDFFSKHLLTNLPCILRNVSVPWQCSKNWVLNNSINYDYFISEYGELDAPVADCNTLIFNAHDKKDMKVKEYMEYIKNPHTQTLYLKDWHLKRMRPNEEFYEVPDCFASDWLNEYALDHQEDDFMFVYIGPSGSWTPLHADVYSSYSWSVNVVGLKKWILLPPGEENKLKDSLGNLPIQFLPENYNDIKYYEVYQKKGDGIFVPSGWHHQVTNVQDTISINQNWINGCNVHIVWKALEDNLKLVEREIEEFKTTPEFNDQCQLMLKSLFGMDYESFMKLLIYIAEKRLAELKGITSFVCFNKFIFSKKHIKFDLKCILNILNSIIKEIEHLDNYVTPNIKFNICNTQSSIAMVI